MNVCCGLLRAPSLEQRHLFLSHRRLLPQMLIRLPILTAGGEWRSHERRALLVRHLEHPKILVSRLVSRWALTRHLVRQTKS